MLGFFIKSSTKSKKKIGAAKIIFIFMQKKRIGSYFLTWKGKIFFAHKKENCVVQGSIINSNTVRLNLANCA